jgi:hypothetical protein
MPNHQLVFRQRHSAIEQTHQIVQKINEALEKRQYCSAAFLDIQLWGMVSTSSIEIPECFQSEALCMIVDAPWFVPNTVI